MISSLTALVATTTGKLAFGAAVAAAAVGSAQVTGVVDVVPDMGNNVEVVDAGAEPDVSLASIASIPDSGAQPLAEPVLPIEPDVTDAEDRHGPQQDRSYTPTKWPGGQGKSNAGSTDADGGAKPAESNRVNPQTLVGDCGQEHNGATKEHRT